MSYTAERFPRLEDLYASLSNAEMSTVLDGGSARRVVRPAGTAGDWVPAWVDLDGLWLDDLESPGYVSDLERWDVDLPY